MKILVVGCKGMLGTDLMHEIKNTKHDLTGIDIDDLDITDLNKSIEFITNLKPDCVINCAAFTNVDGCETNIDIAYKVNAIAPRNLAIICDMIGAKLVHISTDYVFDGEKGTAYIESDFVNPLSVYGKSKLQGENNIRDFCKEYFILRTQWLYGFNGKNFVKTMLGLSKDRTELTVVNDQFGSPTYTKDLCKAIVSIIDTKEYGVYHITNAGVVSWYEFTKDILELSNISGTIVKPCTTKEFPRPAVRPKYSPLENFNYRICGFEPLRHYKEALKEYLEQENI